MTVASLTLKYYLTDSALPGASKIGLERGGHGFEPKAQVSNTDLYLSRPKTPTKVNFTPEPIFDTPSSLD